MSPVFFTSAKELYQIKLVREPGVRASCFPFFNQNGQILLLLLLKENDPTMYVLPAELGIVKIIWFKGMQVDPDQLSGNEFTGAHFDQLRELWHYDPWWILKEPQYCDHWAVPQFKATNCVDLMPEVKMVYYHTDLSRIRWSGHKDNSMEKWNRNLLPVKPEQVEGSEL
jgi:hypothetical protein